VAACRQRAACERRPAHQCQFRAQQPPKDRRVVAIGSGQFPPHAVARAFAPPHAKPQPTKWLTDCKQFDHYILHKQSFNGEIGVHLEKSLLG
jgi:hypothetical protein